MTAHTFAFWRGSRGLLLLRRMSSFVSLRRVASPPELVAPSRKQLFRWLCDFELQVQITLLNFVREQETTRGSREDSCSSSSWWTKECVKAVGEQGWCSGPALEDPQLHYELGLSIGPCGDTRKFYKCKKTFGRVFSSPFPTVLNSTLRFCFSSFSFFPKADILLSQSFSFYTPTFGLCHPDGSNVEFCFIFSNSKTFSLLMRRQAQLQLDLDKGTPLST